MRVQLSGSETDNSVISTPKLVQCSVLLTHRAENVLNVYMSERIRMIWRAHVWGPLLLKYCSKAG